MELSKEQKDRFRQELLSISNDYYSNEKENNSEIKQYRDKINRLPDFINQTDDEFEKLTGITNKKDISFLVFASTLQVARQFLFSYLKTRISDKESAKKAPFHIEEHSQRNTKQYYATKAEIVSNPVPFDAIWKTEVVKNNGNPKLNGLNHRYKAIGHDPILGIIFGTANIMTKTITISEGLLSFETYHVGTGIASNGFGEYNIDMLTNQASTSLMFEHILSRIQEEGNDGWEAFALSLGKEIVHLLSDVRTKKSLPIPLVSAVSPDLSRILNLCGIDTLSVASFKLEMVLSKLIDVIIAYTHSLCYNPQNDGPIETFMVRTKKIVYYSNLISISSTTIQTLFKAYMGDETAFSKFDFGGAVSSWKDIWNTPFIISDMKSDYIRNKTINYLSK